VPSSKRTTTDLRHQRGQEKPMNPSPRLEFRITGMDCTEEVGILKRELGPLVGGPEKLGFDVLNGRMSVAGAPPGVTAASIVAAVASTGMTAVLVVEGTQPPTDEGGDARAKTILAAASGVLAGAAFVTHVLAVGGVQAALGSEGMAIADHGGPPLLARILYGAAMLAGARHVLPKAWHAARRFSPDMNLLMTVAITGAIALGEWFEGATVAFLFATSLALEAWSVGRARRAVAALMSIAPPTARVRRAAGEVEVPVAEVAPGEIVIVRPGERIPVDAKVVKGETDANQAPITGESMPVAKRPGDEVFAGTINGDGAIEIESTKPAADSTLAKIIRMVGDTQARRAPSEQWVERFARIYTPVVFASAIAVALLPPLLGGGLWEPWIYRALVLLVIGCPCALVISTPVAVVAALAAAARNGILVKGGAHLESPATIVAVALDKTGTLTHGRPEVVHVEAMSGHDERELLEIASALEGNSDHPLAKAIVAHCSAKGIAPRAAEDLKAIQGKGLTAKIGGKEFWLGSHRYLEERGEETPAVHERLVALSEAGRSVVVMGDGSHVCGFIALADGIRPEAKTAILEMKALGIQHVIMLTGDNAATAKAVGASVGIDEVRAELLPEDKVTAIEALVTKYGRVAMIGDGVNDAPALARSTLGIAMGAVGSDAAIETADIALMSDEIGKLPWMIAHSRRALGVIRQNIGFSLAVKAVFVVLTFLGHASLWAAIAADMGASLIVIFNALRLLGGAGGSPAQATGGPLAPTAPASAAGAAAPAPRPACSGHDHGHDH